MTNQYLQDTVLFTAKPGNKSTELSIRGPNLVLYTEDTEIWQRFKCWQQLIYLVPYNQGKDLIAVDLHFPKSAKNALLRALETKKARVSKRGGHLAR